MRTGTRICPGDEQNSPSTDGSSSRSDDEWNELLTTQQQSEGERHTTSHPTPEAMEGTARCACEEGSTFDAEGKEGRDNEKEEEQPAATPPNSGKKINSQLESTNKPGDSYRYSSVLSPPHANQSKAGVAFEPPHPTGVAPPSRPHVLKATGGAPSDTNATGTTPGTWTRVENNNNDDDNEPGPKEDQPSATVPCPSWIVETRRKHADDMFGFVLPNPDHPSPSSVSLLDQEQELHERKARSTNALHDMTPVDNNEEGKGERSGATLRPRAHCARSLSNSFTTGMRRIKDTPVPRKPSTSPSPHRVCLGRSWSHHATVAPAGSTLETFRRRRAPNRSSSSRNVQPLTAAEIESRKKKRSAAFDEFFVRRQQEETMQRSASILRRTPNNGSFTSSTPGGACSGWIVPNNSEHGGSFSSTPGGFPVFDEDDFLNYTLRSHDEAQHSTLTSPDDGNPLVEELLEWQRLDDDGCEESMSMGATQHTHTVVAGRKSSVSSVPLPPLRSPSRPTE